MKSQLLTVLIVVGVLGTASAAMAINTDTLLKIDSGDIGRATEVLVPVVSGGETSSRRLGPPSIFTPTPTSSPASEVSGNPGTSQTPAASTSPSQTGSSVTPSTGGSGQVDVKVLAPVPTVPVPGVQISIDGTVGLGEKTERDD